MLKIALSLALCFSGTALAAPASEPVTATATAGAQHDWLDIEVGKSIVLDTPRPPRAISITRPDVASIVQLGTPTKWQIQGLSVGTTDLVLQFDNADKPVLYEVTVHQDLSDLVRRIQEVTGEDGPRVYPLNEHIVVEGVVPDLDTLERVTMIAQLHDPEFVNLLRVNGDHQVQLEVVYAEVSRTGLRDMGVQLLWNAPQGMAGSLRAINRGTIENGGSNILDGQDFTFNSQDFNLLGYVGQGINILAVLNMLEQYGLSKVLAQPTLVSLSGQKAEFLNGGRVPVIIPNPMGNSRVQFQPFGTRMLFIPTVLADDVIDVIVDLEISDINTSYGVVVNGISAPGFTAREVKAHVRLKSGMTFAVAGLLSEQLSYTNSEVPGLGRIPVIGALFRNTSHRREEKEVMVYVTPRLVRPMAEDEIPPLPGTTEDNNPSDLALFLLGMDHRAGSRTAEPTGIIGLHR